MAWLLLFLVRTVSTVTAEAFESETNEFTEAVKEIWGSITKKFKLDVVPQLSLAARVVAAKAGLYAEKVKDYINVLIEGDPPAVDLNEWNVCLLAEREILKGNFVRYRFELGDPAEVVPLYPGQEVN
jgi:hypothetical protein